MDNPISWAVLLALIILYLIRLARRSDPSKTPKYYKTVDGFIKSEDKYWK